MYNNIGVASLSDSVKLAVGSSTNPTAAVIPANIVLLLSTTACHIAVGTAPTATTDNFYLPANVPLVASFDPTHKLAAIRASADGSLFITPLG
jgi:hypothetical protein